MILHRAARCPTWKPLPKSLNARILETLQQPGRVRTRLFHRRDESMSEKRRGLGRGLGALIPSSPAAAQGNGAAPSRPVDLFFPEARKTAEPVEAPDATAPAPTADSATTSGAGGSRGGAAKDAPQSAS